MHRYIPSTRVTLGMAIDQYEKYGTVRPWSGDQHLRMEARLLQARMRAEVWKANRRAELEAMFGEHDAERETA